MWHSMGRMESEDKNLGSQSYVIDKGRLPIRLTAPYSEARRIKARERAREAKLKNLNKLQETATNYLKSRTNCGIVFLIFCIH